MLNLKLRMRGFLFHLCQHQQELSNSGGRISVNRLRLALTRSADGFGVEQNMPSLAVPTLLSHDPPIASTAELKLHESSVSESKGVGD